MTAFFTDFAERNARTGRPSPTPLEIQRWEDDGGAVLPRLTEGGSSFGCEYASALWRRDDSNLVVRSNRYPRHFSVGCLTVWFDGPNHSPSGPNAVARLFPGIRPSTAPRPAGLGSLSVNASLRRTRPAACRRSAEAFARRTAVAGAKPDNRSTLSAEASEYPEAFPIMEALLWRRAVAGPVRTTDVRIRELVAAD